MKYLTVKNLYDYACSIGVENYPLIIDAPFSDRFFLTQEELEEYANTYSNSMRDYRFEIKLQP